MVVIYDHLCHSIFNPPTKLNYVTLLVIFSPYILNGNADSRMVTQKPKKHTCCMQIVSCVRNVISTEEAEKKLNLMLLAHPSSCFLHTQYQYSKSYNALNLMFQHSLFPSVGLIIRANKGGVYMLQNKMFFCIFAIWVRVYSI